MNFASEPDTMYFMSFDRDKKLNFSILARLSGTENKFSVKIYGTLSLKDFFLSFVDDVFFLMALKLKDRKLEIYKDEIELLSIIAQGDKSLSSEELIASMSKKLVSKSEKAYFMMLIQALSDKGEKLANYDGSSLVITSRGRKFLDVLKK